jgi:hypothetical protein
LSTKEYLLLALGGVWLLASFGLYFFVFNGSLSNKASDWGSFGGYISGIITVPFSILSAFFLFKTFRSTQLTYDLAIEEKRINIAHEAIKEASNFLELSLDNKITIDNDELTFREISYNPKATKEIMGYLASYEPLKNHYRVTVGKAFLCLYDFLRTSEENFGQTDVIRLHKIRYQWIINLHNEFELGVFELKDAGVTSKDIHKYFYTT